MTEQVLADTNSQNQVNVSPAPASTPPVSHGTVGEKMLSQTEVNEIVGRTKSEAEQRAYERAKRELSTQPQSTVQASPQSQQSIGGMQQQTPEELNKLIDQRLAQQSQASAASQFVNSFIQKMDAGKTKYSDFEQSVAKLNLQNIPDIVQLAHTTENTADVMYDLSKNPQNVIKIRELNQISPQLAFEEMQKLSASIKQNEAAANQKTANEPLGQVKPSTTCTDNGSLSVRDYKKASWAKA
jgi:hypothetical protein